tara:strand:+ start:1780 stop:2289 length:510 start_codon:yes stop_codon:yes gene_type:complete
MSELRTNRIVPRDGLTSGTNSAGGIIQIQQGIITAPASTSTSGSFTDTGLTATITPTRSDSKVFCMVSLGSISASSGTSTGFRLVRGSTDIGMPDSTALQSGFTNIYDADQQILASACFNFLDSPATTSATTYKVTWRNSSSTSYLGRFNGSATDYNGVSTLILMEVSG